MSTAGILLQNSSVALYEVTCVCAFRQLTRGLEYDLSRFRLTSSPVPCTNRACVFICMNIIRHMLHKQMITRSQASSLANTANRGRRASRPTKHGCPQFNYTLRRFDATHPLNHISHASKCSKRLHKWVIHIRLIPRRIPRQSLHSKETKR